MMIGPATPETSALDSTISRAPQRLIFLGEEKRELGTAEIN